jgi:hypothetical protein
MSTLTFDTLKFVKTLESAGVPAAQAEAFSAAVQGAYEVAELATKADLREYDSAIRIDLQRLEERIDNKLERLETKLLHEISDVRHEISDVRREMKEMELRLTIKLGTIVVLALGAFTAISKFIA